MIRKLDNVRAGRATTSETLIRSADKYWFRFLGVVHRWTIRCANAHGQREKQRRFNRLMVLADGHHWKN
jgi:hypothetical protein